MRPEIDAALVSLNFYIMAAVKTEGAIMRDRPPRLLAFDYYWNEKPERLFKLPEWLLLKKWNDSLDGMGTGIEPPLYTAIALFERLTIPPLNRCLSRQSMKFVRSVLARTDVADYWKRKCQAT